MRLKYRIQEWLADRVSWVQYPHIRPTAGTPSLLRRYQRLTRKERAWIWFYVFWGAVGVMAVVGNSL